MADQANHAIEMEANHAIEMEANHAIEMEANHAIELDNVLVKVDNISWQQSCLEMTQENLMVKNSDTGISDEVVSWSSIVSVQITSSNQIKVIGYPLERGLPRTRRIRKEFLLELENDSDKDVVFNKIQSSSASHNTKKLLVFVNPFSGRKLAPTIWEKVSRIVEQEAGVECQVISTARADHAKDLVQELELDNYGGIVAVSGDGLIHEVLNGLYKRQDWNSLRIPLGIIPGGTGNAIACSVLHHQKENFSELVVASALNIAMGRKSFVDLMEIETEEKRYVSMLGVCWGMISETDLSSEVWRWMGPLRNYFWVAWRGFFPISYHGSVSFLPMDSKGDAGAELPNISEPVPENWVMEQGPFSCVYACNQSWLDDNALLCPKSLLNDGVIWLVIIKDTMSFMDKVNWFSHLERGIDHFPMVKIIPVRCFRFDPAPVPNENPSVTVDAEQVPTTRIQGKILPRKIQLLVKESL